MKENNICYHPWVGLEISPQGEFRPCCKYSDSLADNLSDYLNNKKIIEIKQEFLNGGKPAGCKKCWDDEAAGHTSKRIEDWKYIFNETIPDLSSLKVLSFPFGNTCNLACRSCSSAASSTWIVESKKLIHSLPDLTIKQHQRYYQDKNLLTQLKSIGTDLTDLYFPGGEPFLAGVNEHLDFLEFFVTNNKSQNVTLHYMTNGTVFPDEKFWNLWKNFKQINLQISIDGIGPHFEYTRWPAVWNDLVKNLDLYKKFQTENQKIKITVGYVVSVFTVFYLPEFHIWLLKNKLNNSYISLLSDPDIYNIKVFPLAIKNKIAEKLSRFKFNNIVSYMYDEDLSDQFSKTIRYTQTLDNHRNQSFAETFPEFYNILKEEKWPI